MISNPISLVDISIDVSYGYTASAEHSPVGPKFLRITDIREGSIDWESVPYCTIDEKNLVKNKLEVGDIVVARTGATTRINQIIKEDTFAVFASYLIRFRINKKLADPFFIGHYLKSKFWIDHVASIIGGSAQPGANAKQFGEFVINLPPLPTQKAIAEILSSLDDKIELNNQINQNLEALAQALFKQWFVDFEFPNENGEPYKSSGGEMMDSELGEIPKGWNKLKLAEIILKANTGADAIKRAPIVDHDTGIRCVRVGDMTNNRPFNLWGFCEINVKDYKNFKLEINDIIVTRTATLGINRLINEEIDGVFNNGLIRLKIDNKKALPLFVYRHMQSEDYKIYIERISGDSSTRPNMQINYLLDYRLFIPDLSTQTKFFEVSKSLEQQIDHNISENHYLSKLRDTLLPKLISGELEVSEASLEPTF